MVAALGLLEGRAPARLEPSRKPAIDPITTLYALGGFFGLLAVAVGAGRSGFFTAPQTAPLAALLAVTVAAGVGFVIVLVTR